MTVREAFDSFCYTLNFFKIPFTLHFTSKRRLISNKLGTILTIAIIIYLVNEIFSSNMYQKTSPSIINQKIFPTNRPQIIYNKNNFELAFGIFDLNLNGYELDETIYNISLFQVKSNIVFNDSTMNPTKEYDVQLYKNFHLCNNSDFGLSKLNVFYPKMMCLDEIKLETSGFLDEQKFSLYGIELNFCNNQTAKKPCLTKEKILEHAKNKFLGLHYIDYNLNFNNFMDPIAVTSQTHKIILDPRYKKEESIYLSELEFHDDFNNLKKDPQITKRFTKISTSSELLLQNNDFLNETIAVFKFYSGKEVLQSMRTYQKLSELLSSIGGSASLFISLGFILMNVINEWTLRMSLFKKLYIFDEQNSNQDQRTDNENEKYQEKIMTTTVRMKKEIEMSEKKDHFFKIEKKELKEDSVCLENFELKDNLGVPKVKQKGNFNINFRNHFIYLFKSLFRLKLNKNDLRYKILDIGYCSLMNGLFIYKKIQELELFKKISLSEKAVCLMHLLKQPRFNLNSQNLMRNLKSFELYPIDIFDNEVQKFKDQKRSINELFSEFKNEEMMKKNKKERNLKKLSYLVEKSK